LIVLFDEDVCPDHNPRSINPEWAQKEPTGLWFQLSQAENGAD